MKAILTILAVMLAGCATHVPVASLLEPTPEDYLSSLPEIPVPSSPYKNSLQTFWFDIGYREGWERGCGGPGFMPNPWYPLHLESQTNTVLWNAHTNGFDHGYDAGFQQFLMEGGRVFGELLTNALTRIASAGTDSATERKTVFRDCIFGGYDEAKARMALYKHVVLVCVYEDHWEDKGPHKYAPHHFKGTVVRAYKGQWIVSEQVSFVHDVDSRARTEVNRNAGDLMFVFTDQHTSEEFGVDVGDFLRYDQTLGRQLDVLFPRGK